MEIKLIASLAAYEKAQDRLNEIYQTAFQLDWTLDNRFKKALAQNLQPRIYVATKSQGIVGLLYVTDYDPTGWWGAQVYPLLAPTFQGIPVEINELAVAPAFQKLGIATALMTQLIQTEKTDFILSTRTFHNEPVKYFYEKLGFKKILAELPFPPHDEAYDVYYRKQSLSF